MKKLSHIVSLLTEETKLWFTSAEHRREAFRHMFYAVYNHYQALVLSFRFRLQSRYLMTVALGLAIFMALQFFLSPYKAALSDLIASFIKPVVESSEQTASSSSEGWWGVITSLIAWQWQALKEYYATVISQDTVEYFFSFEIYKYILLTLITPALADVMMRVRDALYQTQNYSEHIKISFGKRLLSNYKRSVKLSLLLFFLQLFLTLLLSIFSPVSTLFLSIFFTGFMIMDQENKIEGISPKDSLRRVWDLKWFTLGIGASFMSIAWVPFIGPAIAPLISSVAASVGIFEIETKRKLSGTGDQNTNDQIDQNLEVKEKAFLAAEKEARNFSMDFSKGFYFQKSLNFAKEHKARIAGGSSVLFNFFIVSVIWIMIWYSVFNFRSIVSLLQSFLPISLPETPKGEEAVFSIFDYMGFFFQFFLIVFISWFQFYRFFSVLFHVGKIRGNSKTISKIKAEEGISGYNLSKLLSMNVFVMIADVLLTGVLLYVYLISDITGLGIGLILFIIIDAILAGTMLMVSRKELNDYSFGETLKVLWLHKGFVIGSGLLSVLVQHFPFLSLKYFPLLPLYNMELGIKELRK
jgi:hypothetical protein